jgi:hypothetical protein
MEEKVLSLSSSASTTSNSKSTTFRPFPIITTDSIPAGSVDTVPPKTFAFTNRLAEAFVPEHLRTLCVAETAKQRSTVHVRCLQ